MNFIYIILKKDKIKYYIWFLKSKVLPETYYLEFFFIFYYDIQRYRMLIQDHLGSTRFDHF